MRTLFEYGPGIPRYLGMWLVLLPVLVIGLRRWRVRTDALVVVALTTLPSLSRNPPQWFGFPFRWVVLTASLVLLVAWTVARVRSPRTVDPKSGASRRAMVGLVALALALRVPLAWWDPGISQIGTSTEIAVEQLLDGRNPYPLPNPDADYGTYQYPAGTLLAHTPLVAAVPDEVAGEEHLGIRATLWLTDAAATALLATTVGAAAAFAYAVHPTLVRESGMSVANDVLLALLVLGAAIALTRRRPVAAGVLAGLAVSVKPAAVLALPVLLAAAGWVPALVGAAVPAVLQLPFAVWQSPGLDPLKGIAEPAARDEPLVVLRESVWYPLYSWLGHGDAIRTTLAVVGVGLGVAAALWAGRELRRRGVTVGRAAAAFSLPLLVSYALATVPRTNYQDWYLSAFVALVALSRPRDPE